jgi:hypothetical protein
VDLRARVSVEPGSLLAVLAEAGEQTTDLEVLVVRHHASGWVREIARKDEDAQVEAEFDPEGGVVTVYEGRPEFRALERAARRAGIAKRRLREYLPYRMLEVEVAANAVYAWAAEQILEHRLAEERPNAPADYPRAVRAESQGLRHRFHGKLMQAFLDPAVFEAGCVSQTSGPGSRTSRRAGCLLERVPTRWEQGADRQRKTGQQGRLERRPTVELARDVVGRRPACRAAKDEHPLGRGVHQPQLRQALALVRGLLRADVIAPGG